MSSGLDGLLWRLERLERKYQRLKRVTITGFLVFVGFVGMALSQSQERDTVFASSFVLRDKAGTERGQFRITSSGDIELNLGTLRDAAYARLSVRPEALLPGVRGGGAWASIQLSSRTSTGGLSGVKLAANDPLNGTTLVNLMHMSGERLIGLRLQARADLSGGYSVYRGKQEPEASPSRIVNIKESPLALLWVGSDGLPALVIRADSAGPGAVLDPTSMMLFGATGNVLWSAR